MFIVETKKKNKGYDAEFTYHRLMDSVRTPKGPRQRLVLNLGRLEIPREEWKDLANRIEEKLSGQKTLICAPEHIEELALHYTQLIIQKEMKSISAAVYEKEESDWEKVNLNTLSPSRGRTIGGEALGFYAFKKLGFYEILLDLGFNERQINESALLMIGRLLRPASERKTTLWAKNISALDELLGTDFKNLSNNALYRASDILFKNSNQLEKQLKNKERELFSLKEKIILYDLTNTYFTSSSKKSEKSKHGRSKERRKDCRLLTLALVIDGDGFPKTSKVFPGNVSEPGTLREILEELEKGCEEENGLPLKEMPIVVMDAGIATEDNLKLISREFKYDYVCVSRSKPKLVPQEGLVVIKEDKNRKIQAKYIKHKGEIYLYCHSSDREKKENAIKSRYQSRFEEGLKLIGRSIHKKNGHKKYEEILERIGRLREKYSTIAQYYHIGVEQENGKAARINWKINKEIQFQSRFKGSYYIRSNRENLTEKELWSLYMTLLQVEDAFRCLKSELGLRPNYHQKDPRRESHLFITVLAYHLLVVIQRELRKKGINYSWETIRLLMSNQIRVTNSLTNDKDERIHIRQTSDAEPFHCQIYKALNLPLKPLSNKRIRV